MLSAGRRTLALSVPTAAGSRASSRACRSPAGDGVPRRLVRSLLGNQADPIGAIVMYDEPSETIAGYAPYTLTVNGVVQPGGGS